MNRGSAIIIGAGPAGLTAAYELLTRTQFVPIVLEKSSYMGGISRTVNYKGNRMDIGGHRFFSKSQRVMDWWQQHMPLDGDGEAPGSSARRDSRSPAAPSHDAAALAANRRIYFLRKFFEYPMTISPQTVKNLGLARTFKIGCSYLYSSLFPPKQVNNLEEFFISRFGRELYSDLLSVVHGESLGRALQSDQRGMGRAAHQGAFDVEDRSSMPSGRYSRARETQSKKASRLLSSRGSCIRGSGPARCGRPWPRRSRRWAGRS